MSYPATFAGPQPSADWTANNPYLDQFQIGSESDTGAGKMGPGYWNDLPYSFGTGIFTVADDTLTLEKKHSGAWIRFTNPGAITVTFPVGLRPGFLACLEEVDGTVTIQGDGTSTVTNANGLLSTSGNGAIMTVFASIADSATVSGELA